MRITNAQINALMHQSINGSSANMAKLMQQMASGERLTKPSDDPVASVRILRLEREEVALSQYNSNIKAVSGSLSIAEANLTSASDAMLNMRDLLLWAANGTNDDEQLKAMAGELGNIEQTLVSFYNARDEEGRYRFSGTLSDQPAVHFDDKTDTYSLTGNDKRRQAAVANGVLVDENVTLLDIFAGDRNASFLNDLHTLVSDLSSGRLSQSDPRFSDTVKDLLAGLDRTHNNLLSSVTELGGRHSTLTMLSNSNQDISDVNHKLAGELGELDYAGASIDLANYQMSLQATQKTYLKINGLSLFNLL